MGHDFDCKRFDGYLRGHTREEAALLEAAIREEGCRDPLVIARLPDGKHLADGFHRKAICDRLDKPYTTKVLAFDDEAEVLRWIERNARARRNETQTEKRYYLGRRYNREKNANGTNQHTKKRVDQSDLPSDSTADRIATEEQVGPATVKRAGAFALRLDKACQGEMAWLRDLVLSERVEVGRQGALLLKLAEAGPSAQALLAPLLEKAEGGKLKAAEVKEALGVKPAPKSGDGEGGTLFEDITDEARVTCSRLVGMASEIATTHQIEKMISDAEGYVMALRALLHNRRNRQ